MNTDKERQGPIINKVQLTVKGIGLPAAPINPACEVTEPAININLTWEYVPSNAITNFAIERKMDDGDFATLVESIGPGTRSYKDTAIRSNTLYTYRVRAINCAGGSYSVTAEAKTRQTLPAPPSNLTARPLYSSAIQLTWKDNSHNEAGFILERTHGTEIIYIPVGTPNTVTYTDRNLELNETYSYRVCSNNELGNSDYSNQASAKVPNMILPDNASLIRAHIGFDKDMYGVDDHWIPNTNEYCRPFAITIQAEDDQQNSLDLNPGLEVTIRSPKDPNFGQPEDDPKSNVNNNRGLGFAFKAEGMADNDWLAYFVVSQTQPTQGFRTIYNPQYFYDTGDLKSRTKDGYSLVTGTGGELLFTVQATNTTYNRFMLKAVSTINAEGTQIAGAIRPGDDIQLSFGLVEGHLMTGYVNDGDFLACYDKKLLWRANQYIDETLNVNGTSTGLPDWNNENPWNDPVNNTWQNYIDYTNPLNPGGTINSQGRQIPILPWTPPNVVFFADGKNHQTKFLPTYSAVAYSWTGSDIFTRFNDKMSAQAIASQNSLGANLQYPSLAPLGDWTKYNRNSYIPALEIYNHVNKIDTVNNPNITAPDAGLNCTYFVLNSKAANPIYDVGYYSMGGDNTYDYYGQPRIIHGDINHLVPGDIVELTEHWAIIRSIQYTKNTRETEPKGITCINSTTWNDYWMVQNTQTFLMYFNGWQDFSLRRPVVK